ncbi:hypothetical protein MKX01_029755 [Papaver californicum]|nr:hypothetical protein MKX01_029755 [Papaver californicum]
MAISIPTTKFNFLKLSSSLYSSSSQSPSVSLGRRNCTANQQLQEDIGIMCEPCSGKGWLLCDFCNGQKTNIGYVLCSKCEVFKCFTFQTSVTAMSSLIVFFLPNIYTFIVFLSFFFCLYVYC